MTSRTRATMARTRVAMTTAAAATTMAAGTAAMVLREHAVDIDAAATDRQVSRNEAELEGVGRLQRHDRAADRIQRAGVDTPAQLQCQCIPFGIAERATLLE